MGYSLGGWEESSMEVLKYQNKANNLLPLFFLFFEQEEIQTWKKTRPHDHWSRKYFQIAEG
jgi:hypothetical protein